jgi:hypothetical protein
MSQSAGDEITTSRFRDKVNSLGRRRETARLANHDRLMTFTHNAWLHAGACTLHRSVTVGLTAVD